MPCFEYRCDDDACPERAKEWKSKWTADVPACPAHGPMVRNWQSEARVRDAANGYPFVTKNITGSPIEVTDPAHHRALCKTYGKVHRDDAAWIEEDCAYTPTIVRDPETGKRVTKIVYDRGSGRGLPGSWV